MPDLISIEDLQYVPATEEANDDEEDDSRRSFVLFDERSRMGSGMMNQSAMHPSLHPFYNLSRDAEVLTKIDNEVLTEVDTTKRVKYLNNYGEPVYAEDGDVD